MKHSVIIQ